MKTFIPLKFFYYIPIKSISKVTTPAGVAKSGHIADFNNQHHDTTTKVR